MALRDKPSTIDSNVEDEDDADEDEDEVEEDASHEPPTQTPPQVRSTRSRNKDVDRHDITP